MKHRPTKNGFEGKEMDVLFARASNQWDAGELRSAFRLFLLAAKGGDPGAQVNLGYFYHHGVGIKTNKSLAIYWYKQAYRNGRGAAASNLGILYRDENQWGLAVAWFKKAVKLSDADANLAIAKIYLSRKNQEHKAIQFLEQTLLAKSGEDVLEESQEEARRLLRKVKH